MADNSQIIKDGQTQTTNQAVALQAELEDYVALLQAISLLSVDTDSPSLGYAQNDTILPDFKTDLTADYASGLAYPIFSDILADAKLDGYDSDFLDYLEAKLTSNPTPTWVSTIKSVKESYSAATTVSAQNFVASIIPSLGNGGNSFSTSMLSQVNDIASTETTEAELIWGAIANNLVLDYQQKAINAGIGIEKLRSRIITDMIAVHTDYNEALLGQARVDFNALRQRVQQLQAQIQYQIDGSTAGFNEDFEWAKLKNREFILNTSVDLATTKDDVRRSHLDFQLQYGRGKAFIEYINSAVAQAELSGTFHGNFTSSSSEA